MKAFVWQRGALIVLALAFITVGLLREEQFMVLKKAAKICFECIGIG